MFVMLVRATDAALLLRLQSWYSIMAGCLVAGCCCCCRQVMDYTNELQILCKSVKKEVSSSTNALLGPYIAVANTETIVACTAVTAGWSICITPHYLQCMRYHLAAIVF
jgi:hypothetical protein